MLLNQCYLGGQEKADMSLFLLARWLTISLYKTTTSFVECETLDESSPWM